MTTSVATPMPAGHHSLPAHEVVLLLGSDPKSGLSSVEADDRLKRVGPNVLPPTSDGGALLRVLRQFHHPLVYVLIASGVITAALGAYIDSVVIFGVVLINATVGYLQESKAKAALDALRSLAHTTAHVLRDGHRRTVPSEALVPGDLVLLEAGDRVPVDARLIRIAELRVDESALTGESLPVSKDQVVLPEDTAVADRRNVVYSGTLVTGGSGAGIAIATGVETELGEIHRLVGAARTLATPLTEKLAWFSKVLTVAILGLAAVTFGIGVARGEDAVGMFTAAVALAVGAIPEGLPAAVTITLAIGVARMARRRAVVRRLPAVETLGSTTVICTDKTGTLTENQMTVRTVWTPDSMLEVSGSGYAPHGMLRAEDGNQVIPTPGSALWWSLLAGTGCNDARLIREDGRWRLAGDPTEGALLVSAAKAGLNASEASAAYPRTATIPFSSERQLMATRHRIPDSDGQVVLVKGAVERVVGLCGTQRDGAGDDHPLDRQAVLDAAEDLAGRGLRVLATAVMPIAADEDLDESAMPGRLVLTGLQAMQDPPREAAAAAVRACHTAGIAVKMITGDHAATAAAIAGQLGLAGVGRPLEVLTGADLAALGADEYPAAVDRANVFARVSPEQKLRLVEALQAQGHVVAMTGDGVNDAPALRQANIGIAMGRSGTEVAKDAADMVLTDDDFATIEAAVEEGRGVFDNLTKFIVWTLPTNMGEGAVILVAVLLGATLPILPTQILWINMTTAVALGLMLAFEPREEGTMLRPPRDPARPLLTGSLMLRIVMVSALLVGGTSWLFSWEQNHGATIAEARTAALNLFVVVEVFYLFSCRSLSRSAWQLGLFSNRFIVVGVTVQLIGQAAITYLPPMNTLFQTAPIGAGVWLRILAIAMLASVVVAIDKRLRNRPVRTVHTVKLEEETAP